MLINDRIIYNDILRYGLFFIYFFNFFLGIVIGIINYQVNGERSFFVVIFNGIFVNRALLVLFICVVIYEFDYIRVHIDFFEVEFKTIISNNIFVLF